MPLLDWLNKEQAITAVKSTKYRLLEEVPSLSYGDAESKNLLIQGDNLEGLKALRPFYAGEVKCVFIDPPYNTKSAFEHYDDNLEHSKWLSMMYPRLELLRELLSEDGSIWITIDDHEAHYLKVICDEIFGRNNFIQTVSWSRKVSPANDAKWFSNDTDFIFVYAKDVQKFKVNRLPRHEKHNKNYTNPDKDPRGPWNSVTLTGNKNKKERPNLFYPIVNPNTQEEVWPPENLTWRAGKERVQYLLDENLLYWGKDGKSKNPRMKNFLTDAQPVVPRSIWPYDEVGHTQESKTEIKQLFGATPFDTPKPERLLERVLHIATNPGDLVLDSFLGSGTSSAVAHKMGRRHIGIELGEHAHTHCQPRLKKVIDGEQGGISEAVNWQGGGGFRFMRLGEAVFDEYGSLNPDIRFDSLAAHLWFLEAKTPMKDKPQGPLLGVHDDTAYYLLYNGVLGDRRPEGGNVLTTKVLNELPVTQAKRKVIYGESSSLGAARLKKEGVAFKQIPYDVGML